MRITLGKRNDSTLSGVTVGSASKLKSDISSIPSTSSTLKQAQQRAGELIFGEAGDGGAVYFEDGTGVLVPGSDDVKKGKIRAINIVDNANSPTAKWRWSMGGLGFAKYNSSTGSWDTPSVAMTNDGRLLATAINGGTLTLGGPNMHDGANRHESHLQVIEYNNTTHKDDLLAVADVNGYTSYGPWSNANKSQYVRIDDGYLTAGEATRNASGTITAETNYGKIYPNYRYTDTTTGDVEEHAVGIAASYGGSTGGVANSGVLLIAARRIGVTDDYLESGNAEWGLNRTISVVTGLYFNSDDQLMRITTDLKFVNGILVGSQVREPEPVYGSSTQGGE